MIFLHRNIFFYPLKAKNLSHGRIRKIVAWLLCLQCTRPENKYNYTDSYTLSCFLVVEFLKQKLFEILQCKICNTHIHSQILSTVGGHVFCRDCADTYNNKCETPVTFTRSLTMEILRDKAGCNKVFS